MRVLSVVGNRPQFIKSAPLSVALRERGVKEISLHTGQHYDPDLSQVFYDELVLVFGDTNSTLAGARAAGEAGVRLAHVEAGLRSGDWSMPEEHARVEVDRLADLLLCADERSAEILRREGTRGRIEVVGDVMG